MCIRDSTYSYEDSITWPTQTPNTDLGGVKSTICADLLITRPSDDVTAVEIDGEPVALDDSANGTTPTGMLKYFPVGQTIDSQNYAYPMLSRCSPRTSASGLHPR